MREQDDRRVGGRLEYFEGHPAAAIIYGRRNHTINLFTWPSPASTETGTQARNGYHLQHWSSNGMTFWAVSDLNETELDKFVSLNRRNQVTSSQDPQLSRACHASEQVVK